MALIKCPECGAQISDKAASCPHCGAPVNQSERPKIPTIVCRTSPVFLVLEIIIAAILVLVSVVTLAIDTSTGIVLFIITAIYIVWALLSYRSTYVSVSNGIVTGHMGIIKSKKLVSPISKVQNIGVSNGLFGKIFRYHTIVVATAGTDSAEYVFKHMANAKELQRAFAEVSR